jgi:DNA primase
MSYVDQLWKAPEPFRWLRNRGLSEDTIWEAQLGFVGVPEPGDERFRGCVVFPYSDGRGNPRPPRFRHLDPRSPRKYDNRSGSKLHLYGVELTQEPVVYLAEGEIDALTLRQMGKAGIGVPGAKAFKREWRWLFRDCDLVVVVMDPDDEGEKAKARIAGQLSQVVDVRKVVLPGTSDVNDLYRSDPKLLERLLS